MGAIWTRRSREPRAMGPRVITQNRSSGRQHQEQVADIFKLNMDCFGEIFDYLSIQDLISFSQTCKRLNQVAGYTFQQNYANADIIYKNGSIFIRDLCNADCFTKFIHKVRIRENEHLKKFVRIQFKFHQIRQIELVCVQMTRDKVELFKQNLANMEMLKFEYVDMNGRFHDDILKFCSNLKRLVITDGRAKRVLMGRGNKWLLKKYPTLEEIEIISNPSQLKKLKKFLELNPNIRKLSITDTYLKWYEQSLIGSKINLEELIVLNVSIDVNVIHQLNALYAHGFYKQLKMYFITWKDDNEVWEQMTSLNGLVMLSVGSGQGKSLIKLSRFTGIPELSITQKQSIADYWTLSTSLTNLERLQIWQASTDDILPFIRKSVKLHKIKIDFLGSGAHFDVQTNIVDLRGLNQEREKLIGARKLTIYVKEKIYLATKWELTETNIGLIRLKREESCDWNGFYI